jgi:hypothetical protein
MAGYVTGHKLIGRCISNERADGGLCLGYILGVADAMQAAQASGGTLLFGWQACPPSEATARQVQEAVVRFLLIHRDAQSSSASGLVAKALSDEFPCSPRKDGQN